MSIVSDECLRAGALAVILVVAGFVRVVAFQASIADATAISLALHHREHLGHPWHAATPAASGGTYRRRARVDVNSSGDGCARRSHHVQRCALCFRIASNSTANDTRLALGTHIGAPL